MHREVVWKHSNGIGVEHLVLNVSDDGLEEATGTVVNVVDGRPFTIRYRIACDVWSTRRVTVENPHDWAGVNLHSDGSGRWFSGYDHIAELDGCVDVDIMATPFTNTLPIRRLELRPRESREIAVVYIAVPSLDVSRLEQRYKRLSTNGQYRYESLRDGQTAFSAEITVDEDGLVVDYPNLFRRVALPQGSPG